MLDPARSDILVRAGGTRSLLETTLVERRDRTTWQVPAHPSPSGAQGSPLAAVSFTSATACTAVGNYYDSYGTELPLAEPWDGMTWTIQRIPNLPAGRKKRDSPAHSPSAERPFTQVGSLVSVDSVAGFVADLVDVVPPHPANARVSDARPTVAIPCLAAAAIVSPTQFLAPVLSISQLPGGEVGKCGALPTPSKTTAGRPSRIAAGPLRPALAF